MRLIYLAACAAASLFAVHSSSAAVVSFDSAADLPGNFIINAPTSPTYSRSSAAGVAGTPGRLDTSSISGSDNDTLIYAPGGVAQAINPAEGKISLSAYFLASGITGTDTARIGIGLLPTTASNTNLSATAGLQARLIKNGASSFNFQIRNGQAVSPNITLTDGNWYKMSFDITRLAAANSFETVLLLQDFGPTGDATPTTVLSNTRSGSYSDASIQAIYADSETYAAYLFQNQAGGAVAADNLSFSQVPEPAGMAAALTLLAFACKRRRSA
jgi:hypothetical protein